MSEPGTTPFDPRFFERPEELRDWLEANHGTVAELFVGGWKKGVGRPSVTWAEIVDEALCFGWIDSIRRSLPNGAWSQRLTPRRKGSNWSRVNIDNVARLEAEGRMRAAGRAAFAARTEARSAVYSYEQRKEAALEPDEEARIRDNEAAWTWFQARPASYRTAAIYWIVSAKRPETRAKRLGTLIEDSAAGRTVGPLTRPGERSRRG